MYRQVEGNVGGKGATQGNDENAANLPGKQQISGHLGPRRNVLGDVSNANVNPSIIQKTALLPKRNLRPTTIQASVAAKTRILSGGSISAGSSTMSSARSSIKPCADKVEEKENMIPGIGLPSVKRSFAEAEFEWEDLDLEDEGDPLMVSEYAADIFAYMLELEKNIMPGNAMELQQELNWHMRAVLIDWLIEVQWKSKLLPETLFLTVNIIDRFLSRRVVSLVKLQLVGLAASLLASKYEEILSPTIANFVYFSDNAYKEIELLKAERYMLHVMNFNMAYPNPLVYLRRISKADSYDIRHRTLAKYLMEVTLLDHRFIPCPPSMISAVGLFLARQMLQAGEWNNNLIHYSGGYSSADLKPWADLLIDFLKCDAMKYPAVFKKYSSKKLLRASIYVQEYMRKYYGVIPVSHSNNSSTSNATADHQ